MTLPKISFLLFIFLCLLFLFPQTCPVNAQANIINDPGSTEPHAPAPSGFQINQTFFEQSNQTFEKNVYADPSSTNLEKTIFAMIDGIMNVGKIALVGVNSETAQTYHVYNPGAIGFAGGLIANLTTKPPVSTPEYIADLGSSLGFAKPAYAQGTGWQKLLPVLPIWKAFRNLSYLFFVLMFVAVGFMIMFRAKINPQTVISVEAAIPNMIITLLAITFSYAIASLMIDLIYVLIFIVIGIFTSFNILTNVTNIQRDILGKSVIDMLFSGVFIGGGQSIVGAAADAVGKSVENIIWGGTEVEKSLPGYITHGLVYLILAIALLFSMFKLFFQLLISYVGIIISVIFAPLQLLGNAMPGSGSLINWLKGLLANALAFPAAVVMILIAGAMAGSTEWGVGADVGFKAANTSSGGVPLIYAGDVNAIQGLVAIGIMMMAPRVVDMIKNALKVEKGAGGAAAAAGGIMGVVGLPGAAIQQAVTLGQLRMYWPGLAGKSGQEKVTNLEGNRPPTGEAPRH